MRAWLAAMGNGHVRAVLLAAAIVLECFGCGGVAANFLDTPEKRGDAAVDESCKIGEERCACAGGDTCHAGLTCASGLCVKLPGRAQPSDAATGSGGASGSVADGAVSEGGSRTDAETEAGRTGAGGSHAGAGGRATGGRDGGSAIAGHTAAGGTGGDTGGASASGGSPEDAGVCPSGQKFCGGLCTPPAPRIGCGLTGCDPCSLTAPANGYVTCAAGQCDFDCLSGFQKSGNQCETAASGTGGTSGCRPSSCPNCGTVFGPACCTTSGKCGCPAIPYVAPTCA